LAKKLKISISVDNIEGLHYIASVGDV